MTDEECLAIRRVLRSALVAIEDIYRGQDLHAVMLEIIREMVAVAADTAGGAGLSSYQFTVCCEYARQAVWPDNPREMQ